MIKQKRLVSVFLSLVKVKSVPKQEKAVADVVRKMLSKIGIRSFFDKAGQYIGGNCGNLYAKVKATDKTLPSIFLNAHIDTVIHKGNVRPVVRSGTIYSDGTTILGADCKAGVAAILEAVKIIREKRLPHGGIKICFTVAEEIGLEGAKEVVAKDIKADFGLVIDGGCVEQIFNRAPSQLSLEAKITGKAAHAGVHPEKGINAIKVASQAIVKMKIGRIDKETTANIGIINGGTATNIVPEEVVIKGEARSHSRRKLKKQINSMTKALAKACGKSRASLRLKVEPVYDSFFIKESSPIVKAALSAVKKIGLKPELKMTGGGSDANIFNKMGVPCLILGVGGHNVHTSKEYVEIKDIVSGTQLILAIIEELNKV
ncbi:MAG: M20/M25/M40 family metallo-hydrolase [Candidatus Margulisiibacteriota bacterium]